MKHQKNKLKIMAAFVAITISFNMSALAGGDDGLEKKSFFDKLVQKTFSSPETQKVKETEIIQEDVVYLEKDSNSYPDSIIGVKASEHYVNTSQEILAWSAGHDCIEYKRTDAKKSGTRTFQVCSDLKKNYVGLKFPNGNTMAEVYGRLYIAPEIAVAEGGHSIGSYFNNPSKKISCGKVDIKNVGKRTKNLVGCSNSLEIVFFNGLTGDQFATAEKTSVIHLTKPNLNHLKGNRFWITTLDGNPVGAIRVDSDTGIAESPHYANVLSKLHCKGKDNKTWGNSICPSSSRLVVKISQENGYNPELLVRLEGKKTWEQMLRTVPKNRYKTIQ